MPIDYEIIRNEVLQTARKISRRNELNPKDRPKNLNMDSYDIMELLIDLECKFDIGEIPEDKYGNASLETIAKYIHEQVK
jgi:acyl carrier protein